MADTTTRASRPAAAGGKKVLGLDPWMWAVGAAAVVLGYLYIKSKSGQQQPGTGQQSPRQGGGPAGWTTETFKIWQRDHHGQPSPPKPRPKPPKGDGNG